MMLHSVLSLFLSGAAQSNDKCCLSEKSMVGPKCSEKNGDTKVCLNGVTRSLCKGSDWEKRNKNLLMGTQVQENAQNSVNFLMGACNQKENKRESLSLASQWNLINGSSSSGPHSGNDAKVGQKELVECTTDNAVQVCMNNKCTKTLNIGGETIGNTQSCRDGESCIQFNGVEDCAKTTDGCHCEGKLAKTPESLSVDKKSKDPLSQWFPLLNMLWEMFWDMIRSIFG